MDPMSMSRAERESAEAQENHKTMLRSMARALCETGRRGLTVAELASVTGLSEEQVTERIEWLRGLDGAIAEAESGRYRSDARLTELSGDILAGRVG